MKDRILIVDDDRACTRALEVRLEQAGYSLRTANSGAQAIESFDDWRPDAVILDASMPGLSGFDVCRHIRTCDLERNTRIVFVTGASTPSADYVERCVESIDADGCLRKPYDSDALLTLLGDLLADRTPQECFA